MIGSRISPGRTREEREKEKKEKEKEKEMTNKDSVTEKVKRTFRLSTYVTHLQGATKRRSNEFLLPSRQL